MAIPIQQLIILDSGSGIWETDLELLNAICSQMNEGFGMDIVSTYTEGNMYQPYGGYGFIGYGLCVPFLEYYSIDGVYGYETGSISTLDQQNQQLENMFLNGAISWIQDSYWLDGIETYPTGSLSSIDQKSPTSKDWGMSSGALSLLTES